MDPATILLLFQLVSSGIDSLARFSFLVNKIMAMTPEEVKAHTESEELRSNLLMEKLDEI